MADLPGGHQARCVRRSGAWFARPRIGLVFMVGALTFFPAVSLGPIVEQRSPRRFF
jgi:K+-transporting ATPase A subunit